MLAVPRCWLLFHAIAVSRRPRLDLTLSAGERSIPTSMAGLSPVVVRLFELNTRWRSRNADFFSLYERRRPWTPW